MLIPAQAPGPTVALMAFIVSASCWAQTVVERDTEARLKRSMDASDRVFDAISSDEINLGDDRVPIYFPPSPPPLDRPLPPFVTTPDRFAAPPELVPYVNELFYPVLGTRLYTETLYQDLSRRLENYRATKAALQKEIRTLVDQQGEAEPAARRRALETLARNQAPKIAALETDAEKLRRDMVTWNFNWSARRAWHLTDKERRGFSPREIATVMRGYAYYHDSLTSAQRRLLCEIAMELGAAVDNSSGPAAASPEIFFSPESARVLLPHPLPPELTTKVAAYIAKKSRLKKELYDAIHAYDGSALAFLLRPLRGLAQKQAPEFTALDAMAEEIRHGLAQIPAPPPSPENSPLPPTLALRVADVMRGRAVARRDAVVKAESILNGARSVDAHERIVYRFSDDGMTVTRLPPRGRRQPPRENEGEILAAVQDRLGVVAAEYGRTLARLLNEQEAIRHETALLLGENRRDRVEAALITVSRQALLKKNDDAYRDYRIAVFEPGLSPGQRRLLFDRAVEKLELPLPRGEIQVSARAARW